MTSPYENIPQREWKTKTTELVYKHPASPEVLTQAVLKSWSKIQGSKIGDELIIGKNYFPTPQILGDFLHELIPIELSKHDGAWEKGTEKHDKDVVYRKDNYFSFEIKSSSHPKNIFGNRSFAQKDTTSGKKVQKKDKSGYYLAINFPPIHKEKEWMPIKQIRFGWIDKEDWQGQASASGQQASLSATVLENKLLTIYQED